MKRTLCTILPVAILLGTSSAWAATLNGTVTDRTTNKPSAGDTVAVINTAQGMDEIAKATSDASGKFRLQTPDGGQILLHITHGGAEYFKSVPPGSSSVDIDVYDSGTKIDGISGEAIVVRAETDSTGKALNVTENFFVQNASAPPRTQYGANTFEFYVPKGAQMGSAVASAPGGLPTTTQIKTVDAAAGHYAFTFPVRPGETRFQVEYSLPYNGQQNFSIELSVPTGDVAVMLPKTMQFQGASAFQQINPDVNALSYDAHQPPFDKPVEFTIVGSGQLPLESPQQGGAQGQSAQPGQPVVGGERPGGGLGNPVDPEDSNAPLSKYKWWIVGGLGLVLAAGAGIMLKTSTGAAAAGVTLPGDDAAMDFPLSRNSSPESGAVRARPAAASSPTPTAPLQPSLLQALKDELFELESDRLTGKITQAQYAEHKAALDVMLRRALTRIES